MGGGAGVGEDVDMMQRPFDMNQCVFERTVKCDLDCNFPDFVKDDGDPEVCKARCKDGTKGAEEGAYVPPCIDPATVPVVPEGWEQRCAYVMGRPLSLGQILLREDATTAEEAKKQYLVDKSAARKARALRRRTESEEKAKAAIVKRAKDKQDAADVVAQREAAAGKAAADLAAARSKAEADRVARKKASWVNWAAEMIFGGGDEDEAVGKDTRVGGGSSGRGTEAGARQGSTEGKTGGGYGRRRATTGTSDGKAMEDEGDDDVHTFTGGAVMDVIDFSLPPESDLVDAVGAGGGETGEMEAKEETRASSSEPEHVPTPPAEQDSAMEEEEEEEEEEEGA